jgi:hypothetical protein
MIRVKIIQDQKQIGYKDFSSIEEAQTYIVDVDSSKHWGEGVTFETEDVTAQVQQEVLNEESQKYLDSTDWYIIRHVESGVQIPDDVLNRRALARNAIVK